MSARERKVVFCQLLIDVSAEAGPGLEILASSRGVASGDLDNEAAPTSTPI